VNQPVDPVSMEHAFLPLLFRVFEDFDSSLRRRNSQVEVVVASSLRFEVEGLARVRDSCSPVDEGAFGSRATHG